MARTDPQINVRLPPKLLETIKSAAKRNGRSMTAEIVSRLEDAAQIFYQLESQAEAEVAAEIDPPELDDDDLLVRVQMVTMSMRQSIRELDRVSDRLAQLTGRQIIDVTKLVDQDDPDAER